MSKIIEGNLPLVIENQELDQVKNYQIYGTSDGTGVETENLWNPNAKDTSNGYMNGYYLRNDNHTEVANTWCVSEYIEVVSNTQYTLKWTIAESPSATLPSICQYDANKDFISNSGTSYDAKNTVTITTTATTKYIRFSGLISRWNVEAVRFNLGSTVIDVPPGYKLPLTVESGAQSQDIPIYIGSSKLGEEEYMDYGEQKIYKYAEPLKIYGWHVDPSISDSGQAITYLEDAVGKTPAAMGAETFSYGDWSDAFFMPKPCMVKSDGTVDYYLDPNDYSKKEDGTASDIADQNYDGNAMMEWPLLWWKYEIGEIEGEGYFYVANRKPDDTYHCWCNYDADNNIIEHFYTAIYNGTGIDKMRSISGVALTSENGNGDTTAEQEIERASSNNTTDKTEWYIDVWADRILINGLLILMGKSLNSQAVFGMGLETGSKTAKEAYVTGTLNNKGLFWGDTSTGTSGVKVFGMENWWGCVWHRTAGLIGLRNGDTAYKLTHGTIDGTTTSGYNTNGNGYLVDMTTRPTYGYFKIAKFGKFGYLPLTTSGSSTTYYADSWYTNNSALTFVIVGGSAGSAIVRVSNGCSFFGLSSASSRTGWDVSSSLSFKPLAKTTPKPNLTPIDPPVPFPPIPLYKGTNTLSSTTNIGNTILDCSVPEISKVQIEDQEYNIIDSLFYDIIADQYNTSLTYNEGDYCIYNYQLYKCIAKISTPEVFDSTKWSQITLVELIRGEE